MELFNQEERDQMGHVNCSKVYVKDTGKIGFGVFSKNFIRKGEIIETGLMNVVHGVDGNVNTHLFTWSDDRTVWASGSGCLTFYNHASEESNIKKIGDLKKNIMTVIALRDIEPDEELVSKYYSANWRTCFSDLADHKNYD